MYKNRAGLIGIIWLAALQAACSTPPSEMRATSPSMLFEMAVDSAVAFRRITEGARFCYPMQHIEADFFPDNRSSQVSVSSKLELIIAALFVVDITPMETGSKIRVAYLKRNPELAHAVRSWVEGGTPRCS